MRRKIRDEFTDMPISRQRKYQLRMKRDGRCTDCGAPVVEGSRCPKHLIAVRERLRRRRGSRRRNKALSYRLWKKQRAAR